MRSDSWSGHSLILSPSTRRRRIAADTPRWRHAAGSGALEALATLLEDGKHRLWCSTRGRFSCAGKQAKRAPANKEPHTIEDTDGTVRCTSGVIVAFFMTRKRLRSKTDRRDAPFCSAEDLTSGCLSIRCSQKTRLSLTPQDQAHSSSQVLIASQRIPPGPFRHPTLPTAPARCGDDPISAPRSRPLDIPRWK